MSETGDRGIRTYVLRSGRMTEAQRRALKELWPRYGIDYDPSGPLDLAAAFGDAAGSGAKPVIAEIGFGMGKATWQIAAANPGVNYLGFEVHAPGVGRLLLDLEARGLGNVRVIMHDAVEVLERSIAPGAFEGLHLFYPDPWPKKRHRKRRLIREELVDLLASRIARGGYLYFVTDVEEYARSSLELLERAEGLRNRYIDFAPRQAWRPETKFESHAARDGRGAWELFFERV